MARLLNALTSRGLEDQGAEARPLLTWGSSAYASAVFKLRLRSCLACLNPLSLLQALHQSRRNGEPKDRLVLQALSGRVGGSLPLFLDACQVPREIARDGKSEPFFIGHMSVPEGFARRWRWLSALKHLCKISKGRCEGLDCACWGIRKDVHGVYIEMNDEWPLRTDAPKKASKADQADRTPRTTSKRRSRGLREMG